MFHSFYQRWVLTELRQIHALASRAVDDFSVIPTIMMDESHQIHYPGRLYSSLWSSLPVGLRWILSATSTRNIMCLQFSPSNARISPLNHLRSI